MLSAEAEYAYGHGSRARGRPVHARVAPRVLFRYKVLKRLLDVMLVVLALPILLPLLAVIALVVTLQTPGPAFFSHRRIRQDGLSFSMWKFRTMCVNSGAVLEQHLAESGEARMEWARTHKLKRDPRVTRVGLFLRRYSLDELPQFWNVLRGEMSLVGPRPIVAAEIERYGACFSCYCEVKPGVTGLWQVSGRSTLTYKARVKLDCEYVKRWSIGRDLKILLLTLRSVVNQDGAF